MRSLSKGSWRFRLGRGRRIFHVLIEPGEHFVQAVFDGFTRGITVRFERLYQAIKGNGGNVRYVTLP